MPIDLNEHRKKQHSNQNQNNNPPPPPPNNNKNNKGGGGFNMNSVPMPSMPGGKSIFFIVLIVVIVLLFFLARPFIVINSGEVGIKVNLGRYEPTPLQPGLHFFMPIVQNILIVDTRVKTLNFVGADEVNRVTNASTKYKIPIQVRDKLGLDVFIELTLKYRLKEEKASDTIRDYTTLWDESIVVPYILEAVGSTVGNFNAEEFGQSVGGSVLKVNSGGLSVTELEEYIRLIERTGRAKTCYVCIDIPQFAKSREEDINRIKKELTDEAQAIIITSVACGCSSSGRAPPCQGGGSEFEPRHPLQSKAERSGLDVLLFS